MSNILEKRLALEQVVVEKVSTGEVMLHFNNPDIRNISISSGNAIDLMKVSGVTIKELRNSNLKSLVDGGSIEIL